ncbi:hypothetical protein IJ750_05025 [bacterium]|nr:hypothetical protein [bacterium]
MQVQKINTNPTFGIKYVNESQWNKTILREFSGSMLAKEISQKYPDATATLNFSKTATKKGDTYHSVNVEIELDKENLIKIISREDNSVDAIRTFIKNIRNIRLFDLEEKQKRESMTLWQKLKNLFS